MQIVYVWVLKPTKPYRLYLRKDTGYWYYRLPDAGKWKSTDRAKENDTHDFVIKNVLAEGKASPTLREFAESTFDATLTAENLETLICMCAALDLLIFADLQALVCQHSMTLL